MHIWIFSYILCPVDNKKSIFSNKGFHSDITVRSEPLLILAHSREKMAEDSDRRETLKAYSQL